MGVHVKLWSWFKGAAALIKMPAGPRKGESQPDAPAQIDDHAAEDASPDDIEIQPERQIRVEPESPIKVELETPIKVEPQSEIRAKPETPIRVETEDRSSAEPESRITVEPEPARPITVESESTGPTSPEEINRRRAIVRGFFNDYWSSVEDKPASFAERLDRAEGYINERVAAGGEVWRLDPATRKQLGLPASKKA
jgi:hypothetical protein